MNATPPLIKISAYKAWKGRPGCKPYDTDFYTEMDRIRSGYYKSVVDKCRTITDEKERSEYKVSYLPSLTISAICKEWRKKENVVQHTGLLNIDIDSKSNQHIEDWLGLRDAIFNMRGIVACFLSVSGKGVTFVVRVNPEQHKDTFFSIVDGMRLHFNINVDAGLHDVTRLRFVSDDPGAKIRYNFSEIPISEPSQQYLENKKSFGDYEITIEPIGEADSEYNFLEAVKRAKSLFTFTEGQKWSFILSVAGTCNTMGMSQQFCESMILQHFLTLTDIGPARLLSPVKGVYQLYKSQHGQYHLSAKSETLDKECKRMLIRDFLHEGIEPSAKDMGDIAEACHANIDRVQYVWSRVYAEFEEEFGYNKFPPVKKVQIWLTKRYQFRFNQVTCQPEQTELGQIQITTVNPDEIHRQLSLQSIKFGLMSVKSLMKSAFVKPYDPILEYFQSLSHDGANHIKTLASYITTKEGEFWPKMLQAAMVRSIACGLGRKENRIVMVFYERRQETGKSSYIRFLNPFSNGQYFTESPIIGGNMKDTEIRFSENFIYNLEELAGLNRADLGKLKADISKVMIKERRAYASFETQAPRRCNFWASSNTKEFLHDDENTRWLVFEVQAINWAYKSDFNINKAWAQAWELYKTGQTGELSQQDRAIREQLNQDYRYRRPDEELIMRHFKPCEAKAGQFYSATEIAGYLNSLNPSYKINPNNIGKSMASIYGINSSVAKIQDKPVRGYWLEKGYSQAEGELSQPIFPVTGPLLF